MFPINVVEKETGISKYLLRMWERRYSFPRPERDEKGERIYSDLDVTKLKMVKTLMEEGYRPSKVINQEIGELEGLLKAFPKASFDHEVVRSTGPESIILITQPALEQEVRAFLKDKNVKKIIVISSRDDLVNLSL